MAGKYNYQKTEKKWQKIWETKKFYKTADSVKGKKNFMLLTEFPYPSGNLHIGHWYAYAAPDILARYFRMNGKNVMYPVGFDAFGLPAENAAIKRKINPVDWTKKNIKYMTKQLKSMGASFDWSRVISTIDPQYYKWTQWIFLKMFEKGLAYRAKTMVNWCLNCKTVLANEQVIGGLCERCDGKVIQKEFEQWMFKITDYADRLIDDIEKLDWPETTKLAQKNWIGRSEGALIKFPLIIGTSDILGTSDVPNIEVFTTRLDTIFGCTYLVIAPEHELIANNKEQIANWGEVENYINQTKKKTELQRLETDKQKTGVKLEGIKAINPFNKEESPIFVADYVLGHYGTGAVMAVPAHDERDFEFAEKYNLPIKITVCPNYSAPVCPILEKAYTKDGHLVDSGKFTGLKSAEAREKMIKWLKENNFGGPKKTFKLHDWVLSRQRYWGVPIPIIKCDKCGYIAISEKDLPVKLPPLKDFLPTTEGKSPLAKAKKWVNIKCPKCKSPAQRETDTMDTFVDSSWYFIRYTDPKNKKVFADRKKMKQWLPVSMYVGGAEHNTMHLLYSRFFAKVLYDLGYIHFNEPFIGRKNHGVILGADGQKMSKSRGNIIGPDKEVEKFGADTVRMYLAFAGPYEQGGSWNPGGMLGIKRFLERVYKLISNITTSDVVGTSDVLKLDRLFHQTIKKVSEDIENFRFNTAISALMILLNEAEKQNQLSIANRRLFLKLLSPFAPHLSEEIWMNLGNKKSVHLEKWPEYDFKLIIKENFELIIQINGKLRDKFPVESGISQKKAEKLVLSRGKVINFIAGGKIKKIIFVPDKLINIVL